MWNAGFRKRKRVAVGKFGDGVAEQDGQHHDIKNIVQRALRNGGIVASSYRQGTFTDISDAPTFAEALNVVARATALFDELPSKVRDRFANDPRKLLAFLDDPENKDEAIKLGLVNAPKPPPEPPAPMKVEIVNPPPSS